MNYKITFSTYINNTGTSTPKTKLLRDLVEIANNRNVAGWNLTASDGYYAGELELSYSLTVYDIEYVQAKAVALDIKHRYSQLEVILETLPETDVRFI